MILYFSGTGNSLYVAKKLAELTGDTAVPISAIHERCQRIQDRIIGFVFPVYFGDLPDPVQDFIRQVRFQKSTYFYGIATCGSTAGRALKTMDRIFAAPAVCLVVWRRLADDCQQHHRVAPPYPLRHEPPGPRR